MANPGVISKIKAGDGSENLVANSAYFVCETAAATAAKQAKYTGTTWTTFTPITGTTVLVKFSNTNTADNPTIQFYKSDGTTSVFAAKNLCRYGTTRAGKTVHTSWQAGGVVALTYDGTSWVMDNYIENTNSTYTAASAIPGNIATAGVTGTSANYARQDHTHAITKAVVTAALGYTPPTTNTNTTYSAGTGMTLSTTTFHGPVHVGASTTTPATNTLIWIQP